MIAARQLQVTAATKDGWIVAVTPADTDIPGPRTGPKTLGDLMLAELEGSTSSRPWRVAVGRPYPGSYGIARSYEEAREGLTLAVRLRLDRGLRVCRSSRTSPTR